MTQTATLPAPVLELSGMTDDKFQRERGAFLRLVPALLEKYRGQYVAIHEEKVVESGPNLIEVALSAYAKYGYVPVYVDLVTDRPVPPVRMPSPRKVIGESRS